MGQRRNHNENYEVFKLSNNKNTTYQNWWFEAKTLFKGTSILKCVYYKRRKSES